MPNAEAVREAGAARDAVSTIDAHRRRGALPVARQAAESALREAPYDPDLHDALARVLVDAGELQLAADSWETARLIAPGHLGALKGLGFLAFRRGDLPTAERFLVEAASRSPGDAGVRSALQRLRRTPGDTTRERRDDSTPGVGEPSTAGRETPPVESGAESSTTFELLCDVDGLVLSGSLGGADAGPRRAQAASEIAVLAASVQRACHHLGLGQWETCLLDGDERAVAVGRVGERTLVLSEGTGEGAVGRVLSRVHRDIDRALHSVEDDA